MLYMLIYENNNIHRYLYISKNMCTYAVCTVYRNFRNISRGLSVDSHTEKHCCGLCAARLIW